MKKIKIKDGKLDFIKFIVIFVAIKHGVRIIRSIVLTIAKKNIEVHEEKT